MAKLTGFMDYTRKTSTDVPPLERIENFNEFHIYGAVPAERHAVPAAAGAG